MKIRTFIPDHFISNYVSGIFVIENYKSDLEFTLPLFANGSPTLVFNSARSTDRNKNFNHLTLFGQTITPNELIIKGEFILIAYYFYPYALNSLFGIDAGELTNDHMEMIFLKQVKEHYLQEQLLNASSLQGRLALLNDFITQLINRGIITNSKIEYVTKKIKNSNGQILLTDIYKELNITERTLQRMFETNVGISPKMYSRICRFDAALKQLNNLSSSGLVDVAYDNGFSDQSHFGRVFKEFTNLTPTLYLEKVRSLPLDL